MSKEFRDAVIKSLHTARIELAIALGDRYCIHCGCTENAACDDQVLGTCAWVSEDECSACRPELVPKEGGLIS